MAMNCGMECVKYLLFVFNFIFAVCGLAIITVGVIFHLKVSEISEGMTENGFPPAITIGLIIIGAIIFVIAFFGCCGAIRDSHCMVVTFAVFLLTILVIQVAIAVYAYMQKIDGTKIEAEYKTEIFMKYYDNHAKKEAVDGLQAALHCCGVSGPRDYYSFTNQSVPYSCCDNPKDVACTVNSQIYQSGCGKEIINVFEKGLKTLGGVAIGVAVIELLGIIFSLCLANAIRNDERRGYRV